MKNKVLVILLFCSSCIGNKNSSLETIKIISHYSSASGIECLNNQLYIIGDDANYILILDKELLPIDSILLQDKAENRIPKTIKPDLECISVTPEGKLLLMGSGSKPPFRDIAWLTDTVPGKMDSIKLDTFYSRLRENGFPLLNIEGLCHTPNGIIISNRGNQSIPENHLLFLENNFWQNQSSCSYNAIPVIIQNDNKSFGGVSGLYYSSISDKLILSVSTEDTQSNTEDGEIGKSYLCIINNASILKNRKAIIPDRVIDLEAIDSRFYKQKIESVCIMEETKNNFLLTLVADNDNGSSTLFKVLIHKD